MLEIQGLKELEDRLRKMSEAAAELDGTHDVPLTELMPDAFMRQYTDFQSLQEMVDAGNVQSEDDLGTEAWNQLVKERTGFADWQEMLGKAGGEWAARKLGF